MARVTAEVLRRALDYERVAELLSRFLREELEKSGLRGLVLGLSGGVDSSALYLLAVRAVGAERVLPVFMPDSSATPREDFEDSASLVESAGGRLLVVELDPILEAFGEALEKAGVSVGEDLAYGNLKARARMAVLYYLANRYEMMVAGSTDRTELLLGYFTKYGDGASDIAPLSVLYKTQVRELARALGAPERVVAKPSAPRLLRGQATAEEELGLRFETIDPVLFCLEDLGMSVLEASEATGVELRVVEKIAGMVERSRHKRELPRAPPAGFMVEAVRRWLELSSG